MTNYRATYYDPITGRFLSRDPAGMVDGPNVYAYVGNNPVSSRDPSGLHGCSWWEWIIYGPQVCIAHELNHLVQEAPTQGLLCIGRCYFGIFNTALYAGLFGTLCGMALPITCFFAVVPVCAVLALACLLMVLVPLMACIHDCYTLLERGALPRM